MATLTQTAIGLPPPLGEEDQVSMSLEVVPFEATGSNTMSATTTTEAPKGPTDSESIIYINAIPTIPEVDDQLKVMSSYNGMTTSFWSAKAAQSADQKVKEGKLSGASDAESTNKYDNYRIRVIEYAIQHSSWMSTKAVSTASKHFQVAKDQLHAEIIKTVLGGLLLSPGVYSNFERILTSIGEGLKKLPKANEKHNKYVLITTYQYDTVQRKIFMGMRTIYFSVSEELKEYNNSKNDKGTNADITLNYQQNDYNFNESVWDLMKSQVQTFVTNNGNVTTPIDIPV